jgi:hypothetical protein
MLFFLTKKEERMQHEYGKSDVLGRVCINLHFMNICNLPY